MRGNAADSNDSAGHRRTTATKNARKMPTIQDMERKGSTYIRIEKWRKREAEFRSGMKIVVSPLGGEKNESHEKSRRKKGRG